MGNFDTVTAITQNLKNTLQSQGIKFSIKPYGEDSQIPASLIPFGRVTYLGEDFEYTHGQRAGYGEASFVARVVLKERNQEALLRSLQSWVHKVRGSVTINALNAGALATSKLVSKVDVRSVGIDNRENLSTINFDFLIRYREEQ